jgi:hypothetical protein
MNDQSDHNNVLFESSSEEESIDNDFIVNILDKEDNFIINIGNQQDILQQAIQLLTNNFCFTGVTI